MIGALGLLSTVAPLATDMYLPGFPLVSGDLQTSQASVQLTLSLFMLGMGGGQLFWGPASDMLGRRRPLLVAGLLFVVSSLFATMSPSIVWLCIWRFLQGFSGCAGVVIGRAIARDVSRGVQLARLFGFIGIVNGLAPVLAPVAGGLLIPHIGWRGVLWVLTGVAVLMLFASAFVLGESLPATGRVSGGVRELGSTLRTVARDRSFIGFTLMQVFAFGVLFTWISSSSVVLQLVYGLDERQFSFCMAVFAVGTLLAGVLNTRLVRRVGMWRMLTTAVVFEAICAIALFVVVASPVAMKDAAAASSAPALWTLLVLVSLAGAPFPVIIANSTALGLGRQRRGAGIASALMGASQYALAAAVTPMVTITGRVSLDTVVTVMLVCALVSGASALLCTKESRALPHD
nr:multidrug effflux MFS transporter [Pseudoclavibacter sp. 13-3]